MVNAEGSEGWLNVVEHCTFVAAGALTVGRQLAERGVQVNFSTLVRAAIVHDASKRMDVEQRMTREAEAVDPTLDRVLSQFGYTPEEIAAAKNTGRQADRYIQNPDERMAAIEGYSVEAWEESHRQPQAA